MANYKPTDTATPEVHSSSDGKYTDCGKKITSSWVKTASRVTCESCKK